MANIPADGDPLLPVEHHDGAAIVSFPCSRYDDITNAINRASFLVEAQDELNSLIDSADRPRVVVNFERILSVTSGVLGLLVAAHQRAESRGGAVHIAGAEPRVCDAIAATALDKLLKVYDSVDDAVAAFG